MIYVKRLIRSVDYSFRLITKVIEKIKDRRNSNPNISLFEALRLVIKEAAQRTKRRKQMQKLAMDVLPKYGLNVDNIRRISESVNTVFQMEIDGLKYTLRIHPPNQRSSTEIQAEILWLLALRTDIGLGVPEPIPAKDGTYVQEVPFPKKPHLRQIVLFKWLDGTALNDNLSPVTMELAGSFMARLHNHTKRLKLPDGISRQHNNWDDTWVWMNEKYIPTKSLTTDDYNICVTTSKAVLENIGGFTQDTDYGLIHFDLHPWNFLFHQGEIRAIDFDECQYAPFLYDIAVPLSYLTERQDYEDLKSGFLRGYSKERRLPQKHEAGLELFMAICHLNMIAWILSWPTPSHKGFGKKFLKNSLTQIKRYNAQQRINIKKKKHKVGARDHKEEIQYRFYDSTKIAEKLNDIYEFLLNLTEERKTLLWEDEIDEEEYPKTCKDMASNIEHAAIAFHDDKIIGMSTGSKTGPGLLIKTSLFITGFTVVKTEYQGRGIGQNLYRTQSEGVKNRWFFWHYATKIENKAMLKVDENYGVILVGNDGRFVHGFLPTRDELKIFNPIAYVLLRLFYVEKYRIKKLVRAQM
jgi:Ser/Thr protein kinase RdoA (MazF antagonist)